MHMALMGLYQAKWTATIQSEWMSCAIKKVPNFDAHHVAKLMNDALPNAMVTGYEAITEGLELPDKNDRHVLAAAIVARADMIITQNLKDFPQGYLDEFGIEAIHPDEFLVCQIDLVTPKALQGFANHYNSLQNPRLSFEEYEAWLQRSALPQTAMRLREAGFYSVMPPFTDTKH